MQDEIIKCEAFLDTLDSRMPFMDTIGETDDYQYLCEAYDEFQDAKADLDEHNMKIAYKKYRKYWKECVNAALAIEVELKKREWVSGLRPTNSQEEQIEKTMIGYAVIVYFKINIRCLLLVFAILQT